MSSILTAPNATQKLADFLKTFLNEQFAKEIAASGNDIPANTQVVKTALNWDAPSTPLSDFPLLKVYKNNDFYKKGTLFRESTGTIVYCVSYPQLTVLPNLMDWVSFTLNKGLLYYDKAEQDLLPPPNSDVYTCDYLIMVNDAINAVYPFLKFNIRFKNFCDSQMYTI
jgi:hypothetical protein